MSRTAIVARRRADGSLALHHAEDGAARLFLRELLLAHDRGTLADPVGADGRDLALATPLDERTLPAARAAAHADAPLVEGDPTARVDSLSALAAHTNYLLYDAVYVVEDGERTSETGERGPVTVYLPLWCYVDVVRAFRSGLACRVREPEGGSLTLDGSQVTARALADEDGLRRLLGRVHRPVFREQYRALTRLARGETTTETVTDLAPTVEVGSYTCTLGLRERRPAFPNPVGHGVYLPLSGVPGGVFEDLCALVDQTRVDTNVAVATDQRTAMEGESLPHEPFEMRSADVSDRFLDRLERRGADAGSPVSLGADAVADFSPVPVTRVSTPIEHEPAPGA